MKALPTHLVRIQEQGFAIVDRELAAGLVVL